MSKQCVTGRAAAFIAKSAGQHAHRLPFFDQSESRLNQGDVTLVGLAIKRATAVVAA